MSIQLYKLNEEEKEKLFKSVTNQLGIKNLQSYHPIFQLIDKNTYKNNHKNNHNDDLIVKSKYRCTEILGKIEDGIDDEDIQIEVDDENEDKIAEDNTDEEDSDSDEGSDSEEDSNSESEYETDDEENLLKQIEEELRLQNTFSIVAKVCHLKDDVYCDENEMRLYIKKSPLLEPVKVLMDMYSMAGDLSTVLPDETVNNTISKINSYHNCSHVEASFLVMGSKLVEEKKCPSFPYYYGCVNGYDDDFHFDISDEYDELKDKSWFIQKVQNDYELIIVNMDTGDEDIVKNFSMKLNNSDNNSDDDSDDESNDESNDDSDDNSNDDSDDNSNDVSDHIKERKIVKNSVIKDMDDMDILGSEFSKLNINDVDIATENELKIESLDNESDIDENELYQVGGSKLRDETDEKISLKEIMNVCELNSIDDISLSELEASNNCYFVKFPRMPVNLCIMEYMSDTLDDLLDEDYEMSNVEWLSVLFQTAFGLAVANKHFKFVHNDLHSSNIMFQNTEDEYFYFCVEDKYYKIPLFGKVTKIIDFARSTFKINNKYVFSDVFDEEGEAYGQYSYPKPDDNTLLHCEHKPNPSFDLGRLATTILERIEDEPELEEVHRLVKSWTKTDEGGYVIDGPDTGFELYVDLGQSCHNAVPFKVLKSKEFEKFVVDKESISQDQFIYVL